MALGITQDGLETVLNDNVCIIADNVENLGSLITKLNERYGD